MVASILITMHSFEPESHQPHDAIVFLLIFLLTNQNNNTMIGKPALRLPFVRERERLFRLVDTYENEIK